jgi:cytochrome P450
MLDRVVETGRIDLVRDLAYPLPVIVIAEMLGIPPEDRARFKAWSDDVVSSADRVILDRGAAGEVDDAAMSDDMAGTMRPYFQEIIARRRVEPRDDLISGLVAAEIEGERLTEHDVLSLCSLLLIAGNVTTTNLIGNAILTLLKHPEQLARLRADLSLLPGAIEEVLRYRSPVQFMFRVAAQDGELGGQKIRAGARVIAFIGSANRDEGKFAHANQFDITRSPNPHVAFGHGVHYCLGAPLARLEARVALTAILERLPDLARASKWPLPPTEALILNGVRQLPLRFTPGPRFAMA